MNQAKHSKRNLLWVVMSLLLFVMTFMGCTPSLEERKTKGNEPVQEQKLTVDEDGAYTSKEEVALYLHTYGTLPSNYITKKEAKKLGWNNKKGNLPEVAPGKSIGGDHYGNYEENLPDEKGLKYQECDIDYEKGHRNAKRIIFSNKGDIYYTQDHYESFEKLY